MVYDPKCVQSVYDPNYTTDEEIETTCSDEISAINSLFIVANLFIL